MNRHLLDWATGDDTGVSSKAILRFMLGFEKNNYRFSPPYDKSDRGRCIRLLKIEPEFIVRLDEMRKISKEWDKQVDLIFKELKETK